MKSNKLKQVALFIAITQLIYNFFLSFRKVLLPVICVSIFCIYLRKENKTVLNFKPFKKWSQNYLTYPTTYYRGRIIIFLLHQVTISLIAPFPVRCCFLLFFASLYELLVIEHVNIHLSLEPLFPYFL